MRVRLLIAACAVVAAGAAAAQIKDHDLPVQAIMATAVNPGALAFWAGGNDPPENESKAEAAARWAEAVKGAQTMQVQGEALKQYSRPGRWNEFAQMMIDVSKEGEAAAKAKDAEKAFEIGGRLYDSCNGCHKTYIPPPPRQS
jgi:cytochrome c556